MGVSVAPEELAVTAGGETDVDAVVEALDVADVEQLPAVSSKLPASDCTHTGRPVLRS